MFSGLCLQKTEIENMLEYIKDNNLDCITIKIDGNSGIGNVILISKELCSEQTDITDYEAW
jgi:hypothetical protein